MKPTKDKPLDRKQVADNMRSLAWYWEQQRKELLISMVPYDKLREIDEAITTAEVMIKTAREKIQSIEYHASELTIRPVTSIRSQLDDLSSDLHNFRRAITPTPEPEQFKLEDYPIPEEFQTKTK